MYLPAGQDAADPSVAVASTPAPSSDTLRKLEAQQEAILRELAEASRHRELATVFGIAGAVFAALRLGIVALPAIRQQSTIRPNPHRGSRARRLHVRKRLLRP